MIITELNEQLLNEMACVGKIHSNGEFDIIVRTNNAGNLPHCHIVDSPTMGKEFHSCIRIDCPEYFSHNGKEDKLNSKMKKEFIKFLNKQNEDIIVYSNFKTIVILWNMNNSNAKINPDIEMPDYTQL